MYKVTILANIIPCILLAKEVGDNIIDPISFPRPSIKAYRINEEITVDGYLNEPGWMLADSITQFYQSKPYVGTPATEKTTVKTLYDNKFLYVSAICYDSNPEGIIATSLEQDFDSQNTDLHSFPTRRSSDLISIHKIQIYLAYHWTHFMIERVLSFFFLMLTEQLKIYILPTMVLDTTPIGKELYTEKQESLIKGG